MEKKNQMWRKLSVAVNIFLLVIVALQSLWLASTHRLANVLNELASSQAMDIYHIKHELQSKNFVSAKAKADTSLAITSKIKKEKGLRGSYWEMYAHYHERAK